MPQTIAPAPADDPRPPAKRYPALFRSFFFESQGLVYVSATRPGEEGIGLKEGGVFTLSLLDTIYSSVNRPMDWQGLLANVNRRVKDPDNIRWGGREWAQSAYAVLPLPSVSGASRLGLGLEQTSISISAGGMAVTRVEPDGPCTRLSDGSGNSYELVAGRHILTHIDGKQVPSLSAVEAALDQSSGTIQISVFSLATRANYTYTTGVDFVTVSRLGVEVRDAHSNSGVRGAVLAYIFPGGPATKVQNMSGQVLNLLAGRHVVVLVNGDRVADADDLDQLISRATQHTTLGIYSASTGQTRTYRVKLAY